MKKEMRCMSVVRLFVILSIFILAFSGCTISDIRGSGGSSKGGSSGKMGFDPYTGTGGLEMSFAPGTPPPIVYANANDEIPLIIELRNKGAEPIRQGAIQLFMTGFDPNIVHGLSTAPMAAPVNSDLPPVSEFNSEGGFDVFGSKGEFSIRDVYLPPATDHYTPTLNLIACYPYATHASATICIDPDPYSIEQESKICQVNDISLSGGQGAPLVVTKIEHEIVPGQKMMFKIHVENKGNGRVVSDPSFSCEKTLEYNEIDSIDVLNTNIIVGAGSISVDSVKPEKLKLVNGKGVIYAEAQPAFGQDREYTTPIQVNLYYGYKTSITQQLNIKNIGNRGY